MEVKPIEVDYKPNKAGRPRKYTPEEACIQHRINVSRYYYKNKEKCLEKSRRNYQRRVAAKKQLVDPAQK